MILAIAAVISAGPSASEADTNYIQSVQELGMSKGRPVTNGFVFIDGKYIEPPYLVARPGHGIFINDHLVDRPCPWPIPEKTQPTIPAEDPEMPATITDKSGSSLFPVGRKQTDLAR